MGWVSCSPPATSEKLLDPHTVDTSSPEYQNPFDPSTYAHFVARKDYGTTYDVYKDSALLKKSPKKSRKVVICLNDQRGQYLVDGLVAMDFPLSSGVRGRATRTGNFSVLDKKVTYASNLYGKMYNAEGKCIDYNANASDAVPEGGHFTGSAMPYWQRLTGDGIGMHIGKVKRRPLSHGCVRLPRTVAETLYEQTSIGTPVTIQKEPLKVPDEQKVPKTPIEKH